MKQLSRTLSLNMVMLLQAGIHINSCVYFAWITNRNLILEYARQ
jgi:hypothetical protein